MLPGPTGLAIMAPQLSQPLTHEGVLLSMKLSVIIPCYNEKDTVATVIERVRKSAWRTRSWWWTTALPTAPATSWRASIPKTI